MVDFEEAEAQQWLEKKKLLDAVDWNDGYITEGLDRCHTIQVMLQELLVDHPAVLKAGVWTEISEASSRIFDAYQKIGDLDDTE
jgi:hypothetical protein